MRMMTDKLMRDSWNFLRSNQNLNGYENEQQFQECFRSLGEVEGDGSQTYFTRKTDSKPFCCENAVMVTVNHPEELHRVLAPAIGGYGYDN